MRMINNNEIEWSTEGTCFLRRGKMMSGVERRGLSVIVRCRLASRLNTVVSLTKEGRAIITEYGS